MWFSIAFLELSEPNKQINSLNCPCIFNTVSNPLLVLTVEIIKLPSLLKELATPV
jgi:hypothetical protein